MNTPQPRVIDSLLSRVLANLPLVMIDGARGVGKTTTAQQHAATAFNLQDAEVLASVRDDPKQLIRAERPVLIDEWQRFPEAMNLVKMTVDDDFSPGQFILTGTPSAPRERGIHSGAGRAFNLYMHPFSLVERKVTSPTVSINTLLNHDLSDISGETQVTRSTYFNLIARSGFPAIALAPAEFQHGLIRSYIQRLSDKDIIEIAGRQRRVSPTLLRRWMGAYARETATDAAFEKIRKHAHRQDGKLPAWQTANNYRIALENLGVIDEQPAWGHPFAPVTRVKTDSLRHLVDPALAVELLSGYWLEEMHNYQTDANFNVKQSFIGRLFQSLVTQSVRVYAIANSCDVFWLGTWKERDEQHEVDIVVVNAAGKVLAIEVKLAPEVDAKACQHLNWLRAEIGPLWADGIVINTGNNAYRREHDGIGVVPAALLGP